MTESRRTRGRRSRSRSGSRHHSRSQRRSGSKTHSSSSPSPTRKHSKSGREELKGEMNKIKPPTFDGDHKKEEYAETWLLGMKKYFQLQKLFYSCRRKNCNVPIERKGIHVVGSVCAGAAHQRERGYLEGIQEVFERKYLTKRYYDRKMKEFFELNLGSMTIDEYEQSFLELLKYVPFIKDEAVKIQRYLRWDCHLPWVTRFNTMILRPWKKP
jgi:hypothetical protein